MSKPSGGIRSLPSLSAWGLPTPVVALGLYLQCWFFEMLLVQAGNLILYGVCKLVFLGSPFRAPEGRALC